MTKADPNSSTHTTHESYSWGHSMESDLVSIVMPAFNAEKHIRASIDSVLAQTYSNFELIIINDASTDGTASLLNQFSAEPRVRLITNNSNLGLPSTRNKGIQVASGKYVALLDSDDIWLPEFLQNQVAILHSNPEISLLGCDFDFIDQDGQDITEEKVLEQRKLINKNCGFIEYDLAYLIKTSPLIPSTWVSTKSNFLKLGLFDPDLRVCEDHALILAMSMIGKVCETTEVMAKYRKHEGQLTSKHDLFLEYRAKAFESFLQKFPGVASQLPRGVFNARMAELQRQAADHYFWNTNNFDNARYSYLRALRFTHPKHRFNRWRNLLITLLPQKLLGHFRK